VTKTHKMTQTVLSRLSYLKGLAQRIGPKIGTKVNGLMRHASGKALRRSNQTDALLCFESIAGCLGVGEAQPA
jgi:hypothetical protein